MTKPTPSLTKTCSVCGLQKPLSAFLQMDKQGAVYGSVCSTCRHERRSRATPIKDETTTTGSTITIDAKAKVKLDTAKEDLFEKTETEYHEERDKDAVKETEEVKKTDQTQKEERKHRETFLSRRPTTTTDKTFVSNRTSDAPEQRTEQAAQESSTAEKTTQQEQATKIEQKEKDVDLTASTDTQIGKIKFREGESFKAFAARETNSAISRIFGQQPQKQQPNVGTTWQSKDQPAKPADNIQNEGPSEFAERKWGPGSRK